MVTIEQLFRQAQQAGAAEIYLMAGRKPAARIGGKIKNLDYPELSSTEAEKILTAPLTSQNTVNAAYTKLQNAMTDFQNAMKPGTMPNTPVPYSFWDLW